MPGPNEILKGQQQMQDKSLRAQMKDEEALERNENCDCINSIKERLKKKFEDKKQEIESITFMNMDLLSGRPYFYFDAYFKNNKKPTPVNILTTHCAFCGKKIERNS